MHVNTDFTPLQNSMIYKNTELDARDLIDASPRSSDSGIESDCTDGNLSWLLNYKINELPPVPGKIFHLTITLINKKIECLLKTFSLISNVEVFTCFLSIFGSLLGGIFYLNNRMFS